MFDTRISYRALVIGVGLACATGAWCFGQSRDTTDDPLNYAPMNDDSTPLTISPSQWQTGAPGGLRTSTPLGAHLATKATAQATAQATALDSSETAPAGTTATLPGIVVEPGRYLGPVFAAPATGEQPRSFNLNFLAPASALLQPLNGSAADPVTPPTSAEIPVQSEPGAVPPANPVGSLMSAINTPPGATSSIAADNGGTIPNFAPPTETSDLLSQKIPGGATTTTNPPSVLAGNKLGLNPGFIEQVTPKPRSQKVSDSIVQDIIELYGPTLSAGHDRIEKLPGGIVGILHIPTSTFTKPLELSALHIPVAAKSNGLGKAPMLQHPTSRKLVAGLGPVHSIDIPHS